MKAHLPTFLNIGLRAAILVSKFSFIFAAAKFLPMEELGTYSLIVTTVSYALYLLGMEFYTYATREVIGVGRADQAIVILDQFRFYLISYVVFFLPLLLIFWFGLLEWQWMVIFYLLLLFEHLSQEMTRIIIALGKPLQANLLLFVRAASWSYLALFAFVVEPILRTIEFVLYLWLLSSAVSVIVGAWWLRFVPWSNFFRRSIPQEWVWKGVKAAFPFLLSVLSIRAILTVDRYAVEWLGGLAMLGVYTVYIAICSSMLSFMDAAVFQFFYPELIRAHKNQDMRAFSRLLHRALWQVIAAIAFCVAGLLMISEPIMQFFGKLEYLDNIPVLWWLLLAHSFLVLSYVPQYALYAMSKDRWILAGHLIPLIVFLAMVVLNGNSRGMLFVAQALCVAFLASLIIKILGFLINWRAVGQDNMSTLHK